jgi:glycosyltransferase involved in cell wall biosynthesis
MSEACCVVNARFAGQATTGVQRVAAEIESRLSVPTRRVAPKHPLPGPLAHAWEQGVLPLLTHGQLLWSPCNTGPVAVRNQIVTIHDAAAFDHPEWFARGFAALYHAILPRLARRVRKVVTVSSYSRTRLAENFGIAPARIEVVYNGVDRIFTPRPRAESEAVLARYGIAGARYFLAVATREPRKNLVLLLQAWARIRERLPSDFRLLLVGKAGASNVFAGSDETAMTDARVITTGYVPDGTLPALLSGATALVYPSLYEGFGLPVLEAMACRTAVVTTRLTSLPEVAGDDAIYVDPTDPSDLARQLLILASDNDLRADYADRGHKRAARFSWEAGACRMDEIIRSCL